MKLYDIKKIAKELNYKIYLKPLVILNPLIFKDLDKSSIENCLIAIFYHEPTSKVFFISARTSILQKDYFDFEYEVLKSDNKENINGLFINDSYVDTSKIYMCDASQFEKTDVDPYKFFQSNILRQKDIINISHKVIDNIKNDRFALFEVDSQLESQLKYVSVKLIDLLISKTTNQTKINKLMKLKEKFSSPIDYMWDDLITAWEYLLENELEEKQYQEAYDNFKPLSKQEIEELISKMIAKTEQIENQ
ncbi:hypothetical protein [Mycoplasma procyoni]|uniref:hypothetical protein n=1 Tax=Mycoplasma procyoni TaxID=568784 RepID=UPI00197B5613|nr:hypothetical protein [Mycoplasma procyoni]MBN3534379.1 hypothetical protein [Mycoplasma procyoni]